LCGEVRYRITAAPVEALYCHCRMCQRAHGAPVVAWLTVPLDAFAVTAGNPVAYRSSAKAFRHFCGSCGTPLTWREADNPRLVDISIASLDNPEAITPTIHIWTDSRIAWFESADHLPWYPTNEPQNGSAIALGPGFTQANPCREKVSATPGHDCFAE
jgi:hypothetical protein